MSGYVAMSRNWQDHDLFAGDEFSRRDAWQWLIANAAWKPTTARINGLPVEVKRGELCFSQRFMAEKWGWSKSRVDRFIQLLKAENMLSGTDRHPLRAGQDAGQDAGQSSGQGAGQAIHVLSICNFDKYQTPTASERGRVRGDERGSERGAERDKEEEYKPKKPSVSKRATSFPVDWKPEPFGEDTEAGQIMTAWPDGEFKRQFERFRDHHRSRGNRFVDWQAAWGTWVRNSVQFGRPPSGARPSSEPVPLYKHLSQQQQAAAGR